MSTDFFLKLFNLGLIGLFLVLILAFLIAALRGFFRGIWKSTHNMIFMLSLILISFITLNAFADFVGNFPLNIFIKGTLYVSRTVNGETLTCYVPVTSLKETLTEYVKNVYLLYNASVSEQSAVNFALAFANSALKVVVVIIDMIFIVTFGNLFCFLSWILIFRHLIPRVARKRVKMRWISLAETAVTFIMVTFLFMTPFTAIVNSVNQAYKRNDVQNKTDNETIISIGNFVNAYDNSIFAKVFFNWTVDDQGMTYDARLFDSLTAGVSGEYTINLVREIVNITNLAANGAGAITTNEQGETVIEIGSLITSEIAGKAFDAVINSTLIQYAIPIIVEVALNSDLLAEYIPGRLVDLSDVKWEEEIGYIRDMVDCVFESQVIDNLFYEDETGARVMRKLEGNDLVTFIESVVYSDNFVKLLDVFKAIDKSKALSRAVPALLQYLINSDKNGVAKQYLPLTWEELNEFAWGYETYVLFDFLHSVAELDDNFLKTIFAKTGLYQLQEGETIEDYNLAKLISAHAEEFKELVVGKTNSAGQFINVDERGQTKVFDENGERIPGTNYCLFDMNLVAKVLPSILDRTFDLEALQDVRKNLTDADLELFHQQVANLNNGNRLLNYKTEFDSILDVVATIAKDEELLDALISGGGFNSLMTEENNFFSIDVSHINYFQQAINKMDKSAVLYSALAPMLKSLLSGDDVANTLNDIGMKASVLVSAIDHDLKKTNHTLFSDFASLLDSWGDLNNIYSLSSLSNDTNALMDKLKQDEIISSFKNVLLALVENPIINPTPAVGDEYEKNENLYGLLEYVFSMTADLGLTITRDTLRSVQSWNQEINAIGNILQFIAIHDLANASSAFDNGLTHDAIAKLVGHSDEDYYIKGLFDKVGESYIFKQTLGPFLDSMFDESLSGFLIDKENNVTFSNITNWSEEGQNIENLLKSLDNIIPDGDTKDFFENLDLTTFDKVVDLNAMLHDLAHSGIFTYIDENNTSHYQFGKWLYNIIDQSMGSFSVDDNEYDLLSDPSFADDSLNYWDTVNWGIRPEDGVNADKYYQEWKDNYNSNGAIADTHYIAYKDFVYANGMENTDTRLPSFWCDYDNFVNAQAAFLGGNYGDPFVVPSEYLANDWGAYYGSDKFMNDYESVFAVDEISRVLRFSCYAMRILQPKLDDTKIAFNEIPKSLLESLLFSLNETHCMRIGLYNFYRIAAENVFNSYSETGFSLASAYSTYIIDVDKPMFDFESARQLRREELDRLVNFYDLLNVAKADGVISGNSFVFENMRNNNFLDVLESTLDDVNDSFIFHRKGSAKLNQLTVFQSLFNHLLADSEIGSTIYLGNNSPKDKALLSTYSSVSTKVRYLVEATFPDDANNLIGNRDNQKQEISELMDIIDNLYSLKDEHGNTATSVANADLSDDDNIDIIYNLLCTLNESDLLRDLVPNTIYKIFVSDPQFSVTCGTESVDFTKVDPFYHYYFYPDTLEERLSPNFIDAKYSNSDLSGIRQILLDYQAFNTTLNGGDFTDVNILKNLTGTLQGDNFQATGPLSDLLFTMHDNPIFHTPARNYSSSGYYTDKYADGYTLFEETMAKICIFVGLDDFAYDSAYDSEASASIKLNNRINNITLADDGLAFNNCYHNAQGVAWDDEITSIMAIAYRVADMSTGSTIDIDNFNLEDLEPAKVKTVLTAINSSDIAGDAVAKFVEDGFDAIGLGDLTSYNSVNYANYRIGQVAYGGDNAQSGTGTEINNIYNVLNALRDGDHYIDNVSDIKDFVSHDIYGTRIGGFIRYIYESRILNTPQDGNYADYSIVSGHSISAQGVLLYNVFDNSGLSGFIARDALTATATSSDLEKIETLSVITHMPYEDEDAISAGLDYSREAKGLYSLINITNDYNIDADTFTGSGHDDIDNIRINYREPILYIIEAAYNAGGANQRSALASEFVAGLINNVLENEYHGLDEKVGYAYVQYTFGKPNSASVIKFSDYDAINQVERNGLEGILDCLDHATSLNPATLASMGDDDRHALADNLASAFSLMNTGGVNSEIAKIVYLNDFHSVLKAFSAIPNKNALTFANDIVNETSTSTSSGSRTVYSEDFNFLSYGFALRDYIYPGFY